MRFNLHAIYALAHANFRGEDQFTHPLPIEIAEGVRLEDVSPLISHSSFDFTRQEMGTRATEKLEGVQHALVHRFEPQWRFNEQKELITEEMQNHASEQLVFRLINCLRLIRPTREEAQNMHGNVREDGTFDIMGFAHPIDLMEMPENHKLFAIRNEDVDDLIALAPAFLEGMRGDYWKFRMAVQFHELGHYEQYVPQARYLLWMSAIEALYTSHVEQGSTTAKERIKWFLGEGTSIYPKGEISDLIPNPNITLGQVVSDLYEMRRYIAHGERRPDHYFTVTRREGVGGYVNLVSVLMEAASFVIRKSLLKILRENLLEHFKGADEARMYFAANGLSKKAISTRGVRKRSH